VNVSQKGGTIAINDLPISSNPANYSFVTQTQVKLEAIPDTGYRFFRWGGYLVSEDNPVMINMDCDKTIQAIFAQIAPVLTMEKVGQGSINPGEGEYSSRQGESINITAIPADGWKFDSWSNNVDDPSSSITTLTLN
jgi:hypothetical protein